MAIANELSSDVATAVLAHGENGTQAERKALIEIVRNFYSALRPLTTEARRRRVRSQAPDETPPSSSSTRAASGNH